MCLVEGGNSMNMVCSSENTKKFNSQLGSRVSYLHVCGNTMDEIVDKKQAKENFVVDSSAENKKFVYYNGFKTNVKQKTR